jgi:hypothetical protein
MDNTLTWYIQLITINIFLTTFLKMDEQTQKKSNIPDQVQNINCEELILTPNKIQKELNDQNSILQCNDN